MLNMQIFNSDEIKKSILENYDQVSVFATYLEIPETDINFCLENKSNKIGGCLFVAPWLELLPAAIADKESYNIALPWLKTPINFANIKQLTNNIHCLFSDNDYWVAQDQAELFANKLKANIYCVSNKGHISQEDGVYELPEILTITKLIINK